MLHFLLRTAGPAPIRWQIHAANCDRAIAMLRSGASVEVASPKAARAMILDEIAAHREDEWSEGDFAIMTCCHDFH